MTFLHQGKIDKFRQFLENFTSLVISIFFSLNVLRNLFESFLIFLHKIKFKFRFRFIVLHY